MSLSAVSQDYWSEVERYTIRERCKFMFNNELLSDVKFVVRDTEGGSESMKTIPAHKFVLAISSPVFYAMFYGELAETKDFINISDCEYQGMMELFRFIYSDEVTLNADIVMQVLYLAKEYMLPSLVDKCTEYLGENLDASNVFHVLPEAQKYEEKDLVDECWTVIDKHGNEAVKSDAFVTIEISLLEKLIERDSLNVTELELFKAVDCWARYECEKKNLAAEGSVKRRILGEKIIRSIRFPVMEEREFVKFVLDREILTPKEAYNMMKYFNGVLSHPIEFVEKKRTGLLRRLCRFVSIANGLHYSTTYFRPRRTISFVDSIVLSVDKEIELKSVRLFGSENNEYSVTLNVTDIAADLVLVTESGNFTSIPVQSAIGNYHGFDVVLKRAVTLLANENYCFEVRIDGPQSWYGTGGVSVSEHSGVVFSFKERHRTQTGERSNVADGQFAEFEYSLK